jgi:hypothetical protein
MQAVVLNGPSITWPGLWARHEEALLMRSTKHTHFDIIFRQVCTLWPNMSG